MANQQRGEFVINVDRPRVIQYTFNAIAALEDQLGKKMHELADVFANPGAKDMISILWAGLLEHDENISIKEAGHILTKAMQQGKLDQVFETMMKAFEKAFPNQKNAKTGQNQR